MEPHNYSPVLRRVRSDDWPALRALRLEMLADTPLAYVETIEQARARTDDEWRSRAAACAAGCAQARYVVEVAGRFVAAAGGFAEDDGRTTIFGVYVAPAHRGAGLLAALVEAIAAWSIECGRDTLVLEVARENPRALAAYTRIGFRVTGNERPHPLYPDITELEMARKAR